MLLSLTDFEPEVADEVVERQSEEEWKEVGVGAVEKDDDEPREDEEL